MNIGKYINDLLQENDTVIVPGLGAFISEYKPAFSDIATGILHPPSKKVSFNPDIKTNGGLLAGRIASDEHISHRKAVLKVEKICDDILYRLDKGERILLEDTGTLFYDKNGILSFEPSLSLNFLADAYGLEPVSIVNDDHSGGTVSELGHDNKNESRKDEDHTAEKPDQLQSMATQPDELDVLYENDNNELRGTGLHRFIFWSLILIIPAILIVLGVYLYRKKRLKTSYPVEIIVDTTASSTESHDDQQAFIPVDTIREDTLLSPSDSALSSEIIDTTATTGQIIPVKSKYYLIGGSFKEEENAEKYFRQIQEKGYEPFHLGKQGNFYIVGIGIYDTESEAYIAQVRFIDKYPDSGAWIMIPE